MDNTTLEQTSLEQVPSEFQQAPHKKWGLLILVSALAIVGFGVFLLMSKY